MCAIPSLTLTGRQVFLPWYYLKLAVGGRSLLFGWLLEDRFFISFKECLFYFGRISILQHTWFEDSNVWFVFIPARIIAWIWDLCFAAVPPHQPGSSDTWVFHWKLFRGSFFVAKVFFFGNLNWWWYHIALIGSAFSYFWTRTFQVNSQLQSDRGVYHTTRGLKPRWTGK